MKNRIICIILIAISVMSITSCKNKNISDVSSGSNKNSSEISSDVNSIAPSNHSGNNSHTTSNVEVVKDNINKKVYSKQEVIKSENVGITLPLALDNGALRLDSFMKYSGTFMEDLSFAETTDALAAKVVNTSGKYIDVAVIQFSLSDGTEASFWLSRMAPNDVCYVQEKHNLKYKDNVTYTLKDVTVGYMENPNEGWDVSIGKYLSFRCTTDNDGNNIAVVTNNSKKTIKDAKVWYKRNVDGDYIGGYTYILNVGGEILPGETKFITAKYFNTECKIIDSEYTVK